MARSSESREHKQKSEGHTRDEGTKTTRICRLTSRLKRSSRERRKKEKDTETETSKNANPMCSNKGHTKALESGNAAGSKQKVCGK